MQRLQLPINRRTSEQIEQRTAIQLPIRRDWPSLIHWLKCARSVKQPGHSVSWKHSGRCRGILRLMSLLSAARGQVHSVCRSLFHRVTSDGHVMAMAMGEWTCSTLLMRLPALQTTYVRTGGRASAVRKKQRFSTTTTAAITSSAFFVSLSFSVAR